MGLPASRLAELLRAGAELVVDGESLTPAELVELAETAREHERRLMVCGVRGKGAKALAETARAGGGLVTLDLR